MRGILAWLAASALGVILGCGSDPGPGIDPPPEPGEVVAAPPPPAKPGRGKPKLMERRTGDLSLTPTAR